MDKATCANRRTTKRLCVTLLILVILTYAVIAKHADDDEYDEDFGCPYKEKVVHDNSESIYCNHKYKNTEYTDEYCEEDNDYKCLKRKLEQNAKLSCQSETLDLLKKSREVFIDAAAFRGDPSSNFLLSIRDINHHTRKNYAAFMEGVGNNLYPLIVASDAEPESGVGGVYTLYLRNGTTKVIAPVAKEYEMYKSLSHMALGTFATISPYFRSSEARNWRSAVIAYQESILNAITALDNMQSNEYFSVDGQTQARKMLTMVNAYLKGCLTNSSVDVVEFQNFAKKFLPYINLSMGKAVNLQVKATLPALLKWKEELGDEWENTYVLIPTVWPVSQLNARLQMFEKLMTFKHFVEKVLVAEGAKNAADARTTLGRVTGDRALAQLVFGHSEKKFNKDHVYSLSTRRDLVSTAIARSLEQFCKDKPPELCGCPMKTPLDNLIF